MPGSSIPARDQRLILAQLLPAGAIGGVELALVVLAVGRVLAFVKRHEHEPAHLARIARRRFEVEREGAAVARTRGVGAAAIVGTQEPAGVVLLGQHQQATTLGQLDEALRLAAHVHVVGREPGHERARRQAAFGGQARYVEARYCDPQVTAAVTTSGAAKLERGDGGGRGQGAPRVFRGAAQTASGGSLGERASAWRMADCKTLTLCAPETASLPSKTKNGTPRMPP